MSGRRRQLDQVPAVADPTYIVHLGKATVCPDVKVEGVWRFNDAWLRAAFVVGLKIRELPFKIACIPEHHML